MRTWREIVMDVLTGVDTSTDETVSEAVVRCGNEPPAARSGSLREAIEDLAEAAAPLFFSDMNKKQQDKWIRDTVKHGISIRRKIDLEAERMNSSEGALSAMEKSLEIAVDRGFDFTDALFNGNFDSIGGMNIPKRFPYNDNGKVSLEDWQRMNKENRSDIEKALKRMEAAWEKLKNHLDVEAERKKQFKTPCSKAFERVVFNMKKPRGKKGTEQNTEKEDELYRSVVDWISGVQAISGKESIDGEMLQDFKFIKKCVGEYPDYFSPTVDIAWRGLSVAPEDALRFLPMAALLKSKERIQIGKKTYIGTKGVYKATREIQSWAAEPSVAANDFGTGDPHFPMFKDKDIKYMIKGFNAGDLSKQDIKQEFNGVYDLIFDNDKQLGIVYSMKTDGDFIFSEWFANSLGNDILYHEESEVTRVTTKGKTSPAMVYVQEIFIEAVRAYNNAVDVVSAALGSQMPKGIKKI